MSHASEQVGNVLQSLYRNLSPEARQMMLEVFSTKKEPDEKEDKSHKRKKAFTKPA